ncbi:MAG: hypothetical protein ABFD92_04405 [Planctomycetaceae bacterium]
MIIVKCQGCGARLKLADDKAGKHGRCPKCGELFVVPLKTASSISPAVPTDGQTVSQPVSADAMSRKSHFGGPVYFWFMTLVLTTVVIGLMTFISLCGSWAYMISGLCGLAYIGWTICLIVRVASHRTSIGRSAGIWYVATIPAVLMQILLLSGLSWALYKSVPPNIRDAAIHRLGSGDATALVEVVKRYGSYEQTWALDALLKGVHHAASGSPEEAARAMEAADKVLMDAGITFDAKETVQWNETFVGLRKSCWIRQARAIAEKGRSANSPAQNYRPNAKIYFYGGSGDRLKHLEYAIPTNGVRYRSFSEVASRDSVAVYLYEESRAKTPTNYTITHKNGTRIIGGQPIKAYATISKVTLVDLARGCISAQEAFTTPMPESNDGVFGFDDGWTAPGYSNDYSIAAWICGLPVR